MRPLLKFVVLVLTYVLISSLSLCVTEMPACAVGCSVFRIVASMWVWVERGRGGVSCSYQGTEHFPSSHPLPSSILPSHWPHQTPSLCTVRSLKFFEGCRRTLPRERRRTRRRRRGGSPWRRRATCSTLARHSRRRPTIVLGKDIYYFKRNTYYGCYFVLFLTLL